MTAESSQKSASNLAMFGLLIGCIVFGMGSIIVAKVDVGAYAIAFWRLLVAGIIFFALMKIYQQKLPNSKQAKQFGLMSGGFLGFDLALWHESIYAVGPGISTLLNSLQIFFLALIGFLWFAEKQTKLQMLSLFLAIIGVAMIASPEFAHNQQATWGFVSGIISGAMLAGSMVYIRKAHQAEQQAIARDVQIFPMMLLVSIGGCLALILPMFAFDMGKILPKNLVDLGWVIVYGAVMQCFAWGLIAYSIPRLSLAITGLLLLSEPVVALLIDYFILNKSIVLLQWLGAGLTMLAIYLGSVKGKSAH